MKLKFKEEKTLGPQLGMDEVPLSKISDEFKHNTLNSIEHQINKLTEEIAQIDRLIEYRKTLEIKLDTLNTKLNNAVKTMKYIKQLESE